MHVSLGSQGKDRDRTLIAGLERIVTTACPSLHGSPCSGSRPKASSRVTEPCTTRPVPFLLPKPLGLQACASMPGLSLYIFSC